MDNKGLVEYVKGCVGLPYIYATYGQKLTLTKLESVHRTYPNYMSDARFAKAKATMLGKKVQDCTGLIEGYLMGSTPTTFAKYDKKHDRSADGWYAAATKKGVIATIPEVEGIGVYYKGHVGVYIGGGKVIEARGFDYGVVTTNLKDRPWTNWFYIVDIDYATDANASIKSAFIKSLAKVMNTTVITNTVINKLPLVKVGFNARHGVVKPLQELLKDLKYYKGSIDGIFGAKSADAVKELQKELKLTQDGKCGIKTWSAIVEWANK